MRVIVAEHSAGGRASAAGTRRLVRALACCAIAGALGGCYVLQAAQGQLDVMARSRPVASVVADPVTAPATRAQLEFAVRVREFAVRELGLPDSGSFRSYADIGRDYVVWNVVATPEFSLRPRHWCFPVAGCVNYRGYFRRSDADRYAWNLVAHGDDAVVEGVAAYSTLGHLRDPLLSTMMGWREARLAGTLFHEMAHERLYVADDSAFNEAFASVVEDAGLRRWFAAHGDAPGLADYEAAIRRRAGFLELLRQAAGELERLYESPLPAADKRAEKNRVFGQLKYEYGLRRAEWGGYTGYDDWFARPLDNASLASVATYRDCVPGLERELAAAGSLRSFYARAETLARMPRDARHAAVCGN